MKNMDAVWLQLLGISRSIHYKRRGLYLDLTMVVIADDGKFQKDL